MKAVIFDGKVKMVNNYPIPKLNNNEVLIKIIKSSLSNVDLATMKGSFGFQGIPGHAFVGVIEKVAGKQKSLIGKRVVGEITIECGKCSYCLTGNKNHCSDRKVLGIVNKDGVLAEYITLPTQHLHEVPPKITNDEAVFVEHIATALEVIERIHVKPTHKILVIGEGTLGILIAIVLNYIQADVTLAGICKENLKVAKSLNINAVMSDQIRAAKEYDIVVEVTRAALGLEKALQVVKPLGTIVLQSPVGKNYKNLNLANIVIDEVKIIGSLCGPYEPAIRLLSKKMIDVKPLISEIVKFDSFIEAVYKVEENDPLTLVIDYK